MKRRGVAVLGATGSIGVSTLDVLARHPERFEVMALSAHSRIEQLAEQAARFRPRLAVVSGAEDAARLRELLSGRAPEVSVAHGIEALCGAASDPSVEIVMAAIVGAAGLRPALAAAGAGKTVLLANKEALVMTGEVFLSACRDGKAMVLPIDSEHNAVFQCLPPFWDARDPRASGRGVARIILTASGGPFRDWAPERMSGVTPDQACAHPNWSMGRKISVDSATMMNKGLELIEAHYLFGVGPDRLEVVVHPESIVHSMVQYDDGSTLAQLGNPDMRTPIAHALGFPDRLDSGVAALSLPELGRLHFESPDPDRFPCLGLAIEALRQGGAGPCVLNAANEIAVAAFLQGRVSFMQIPEICARVLERQGHGPAGADIEAVESLDAAARALARETIDSLD